MLKFLARFFGRLGFFRKNKKMNSPSILRKVYHKHIEHFGEPDYSIVFDNKKNGDGGLGPGPESRIEILGWKADKNCDISNFATIGMSEFLIPKSKHRAELNFSIRKELNTDEINDIAKFLANLAVYPFLIGEAFDWFHTIKNPGNIPLYKTAKCVLLHPRFVEDGWDRIETEFGSVHILNVVPITNEELNLKNVSAILKSLENFDIFEPR